MYLSEEMSECADSFPLLSFYRDIVFSFKYLMAPSADAFPPPRAWLPNMAKLRWKYEKDKGFIVKGFGRDLICLAPRMGLNFYFILFYFILFYFILFILFSY